MVYTIFWGVSIVMEVPQDLVEHGKAAQNGLPPFWETSKWPSNATDLGLDFQTDPNPARIPVIKCSTLEQTTAQKKKKQSAKKTKYTSLRQNHGCRSSVGVQLPAVCRGVPQSYQSYLDGPRAIVPSPYIKGILGSKPAPNAARKSSAFPFLFVWNPYFRGVHF